MEAASSRRTRHEHEHHGPPEANQSSRVDPQLLGMLLFIISEVMLFGSFFTAYFFIRVVNDDRWSRRTARTLPGHRRGHEHRHPGLVELHDALGARALATRTARAAGRPAHHFLLGVTFLCVQINEYFHIGFAPHDGA